MSGSAEARLRGQDAKARLLEAEGGTLTADEAAQVLGATPEDLERRRRAGQLLGLPVGQTQYAYPAWQFAGPGVLPGLLEVLAEIGVQDPWMRAAWLLGGSLHLGGESPISELRRGNLEGVIRAARSYGEHGAP